MNEISNDSSNHTVRVAKKPYRSPKLEVYGDVKVLTANGTKNGTENQGNTEGKD